MRGKAHRLYSTDHGAVALTNERLVGLGLLVGEFFSKPLGAHERHIGGNKDGLIIMTPSGRTLAFGSRMSGWDDFE